MNPPPVLQLVSLRLVLLFPELRWVQLHGFLRVLLHSDLPFKVEFRSNGRSSA